MTRTLIGIDYEGVPSLKITKDDLNPITTPDNSVSAFLFNSKDAIQTRLNKIEITSADASNGVFPAGASVANFQRYRYLFQYGDYYIYHYRKSFFPGLDFDIPLTDFVVKHPTSGFYTKGRQELEKFGYGERTEYVHLSFPGAQAGDAGWKIGYEGDVTGSTTARPYYDVILHFFNVGNPGTSPTLSGYTYTDIVTWNLPGNNQPLPTPSPVQPGQKSIRIDKNGLRIAKPGYDVDIATDAQLAVSSNMRPTKIIAADDIAIPTGSSEYPLSVTIPQNSICDVQYYTGTELVYPALPRQTPVGANWKLLPDRIQFENAGVACRARFVVVANDQVSQTVGDNEVFRQFEVNGENVVQFLRPGAGDPPAFSDIVIDSRWPALRILKEGYFDVAAGAQVNNIPIDTTGYFPFVKFMVVCGGGQQGPNNNMIARWTGNVRPPTVGMYRVINQYGGAIGWNESGDTTYARVTEGNVAFHTFRGRPKFYYWANQTDYQNVNGTYQWPDEVLGIRYYIFGIPKKDTP